MPRKEVSIVIQRPLEEVFAYMDDVSHEPEWQPQLIEAEQTPPGPSRAGTRRRYVTEFLGKRLENTYVVLGHEPNRRVVLQTTPDSALEASSEIRWEEVDGGTRVTIILEGRAKGPLRFVPDALLEASFDRELRSALARLKEQLEARAGG